MKALLAIVNGILITEFGFDNLLENHKLVELQTLLAIVLHKQLRPHISIVL